MVAIATGLATFLLPAWNPLSSSPPAMRKEMHWSLTAGALLALTLHHSRLLQPVAVVRAEPLVPELSLSRLPFPTPLVSSALRLVAPGGSHRAGMSRAAERSK